VRNKIELSWVRDTTDGGKELQVRATFDERRDLWEVSFRQRRSADYGHYVYTSNVWKACEELAKSYLN
jgi:hypothetical protein